MWQKVHPIGFRTWVSKSHPAERFARTKKDNSSMFVEDIIIRNFLEDYYKRSWISKVVIRKTSTEWEILLFTAKPAVILWKEGSKLKTAEDLLKKKLWKLFKITIKEIRTPELSAKIMSEFVATQIEWRMPYRRVAKMAVDKIMEKWAQWVKIQIWGRLNGADMSSSQKFSKWRIPLQTIRADIDYHYTIAMTKYWVLGIKVRICKWENFNKNKESN